MRVNPTLSSVFGITSAVSRLFPRRKEICGTYLGACLIDKRRFPYCSGGGVPNQIPNNLDSKPTNQSTYEICLGREPTLSELSEILTIRVQLMASELRGYSSEAQWHAMRSSVASYGTCSCSLKKKKKSWHENDTSNSSNDEIHERR